jgi:hypothetical protein
VLQEAVGEDLADGSGTEDTDLHGCASYRAAAANPRGERAQVSLLPRA